MEYIAAKDAIELLERDSIFSLRHNNKYLTLPEFDNEIISPTETYLSRMFSVLIIVDESDPTLIFNIQDIPKISFKERTKAMTKKKLFHLAY